MIGTLVGLFLFISLRQETVTIVEEKPSLIKYKELQNTYSETLKCSCFTMTIPNEKLVILKPTLHQVCTSDFVREEWISVLSKTKHQNDASAWFNMALYRFEFLTSLCKLANETIRNAIDRFMMKSFIAANLLTETDFLKQINTSLIGFIRSTKFLFGHLIKTERLITNVNQPFMDLSSNTDDPFHPKLVVNVVQKKPSYQQSISVS